MNSYIFSRIIHVFLLVHNLAALSDMRKGHSGPIAHAVVDRHKLSRFEVKIQRENTEFLFKMRRNPPFEEKSDADG